MKPHNIERLANLASRNAWNGSASALVLAKRATALTGSTECEEIVSTVYHRSDGRAGYRCPECDGWHLHREDAAACCGD